MTSSYFEQAGEWLAHFGVKGMHWGVRRASTDNTPAGETVATQKKPGTRVVASGGKQVPAHEDAIKAAISKRKAASSTTDALSNKELQDLVSRMNLEQQYSRLTDTKNTHNQFSIKRGMKTVNQVLEAKKTYDNLMKDPFINETVSGIKKDLGVDKLIRKAAGGAAGQVFKPR